MALDGRCMTWERSLVPRTWLDSLSVIPSANPATILWASYSFLPTALATAAQTIDQSSLEEGDHLLTMAKDMISIPYCGLWIVRTRWMWRNVSARSEAKTNPQAEIEKDEKLVRNPSHCTGRPEREAPFLSPSRFPSATTTKDGRC